MGKHGGHKRDISYISSDNWKGRILDFLEREDIRLLGKGGY